MGLDENINRFFFLGTLVNDNILSFVFLSYSILFTTFSWLACFHLTCLSSPQYQPASIKQILIL